MLQSVVEQKMSLAAYGGDGAIPVLTPSQLDTANKVINILAPIEEIIQLKLPQYCRLYHL